MGVLNSSQQDLFHFVFLDDSESLRESCRATGVVQLGAKRVSIETVADENALLEVVSRVPKIDAAIVDIHLAEAMGYDVIGRLFDAHAEHLKDALVCFTCTEVDQVARAAIDAFSVKTGLSVFWFGKPIQFREYFLVLASHFECKVVFEEAVMPVLSSAQPNELRLEYFSNKQLSSKRYFREGVPHGSFEGWFFETGTRCFLAHYDDGKRHGEFVDYYEDGQVRCEGRFEHGYQTGIWNTYWPNGQPADRRLFECGHEVGVPQEWDQDGNLLVTQKS